MFYNIGEVKKMQLDRRKVKTQKAVREAFIALASEKSINQITVKEIADLANISRKTFYLNYIDMDDLIYKLQDQMIDEFINYLKEFDVNEIKQNPYIFFKSLTDTLQKDQVFTKMLMSNEESSFFRQLSTRFVNNIKEDYEKNHIEYSEFTGYTLTFYITGLMLAYKQWYLNENRQITLDEFCNRFGEMIKCHQIKLN